MEIEEIRNYCLNCKNRPCMNLGCPLHNSIPEFIHEKDVKKAFEILCKTTVLPAVCGRICPHLKQCEGKCVRGIKGEAVDIGKMEAYIGDKAIENSYDIPKSDNKELINKLSKFKTLVIGAGPAGLTCAAFLAKYNIDVTIYEKNEKLGGLLNYGIPDFRLDRKIVNETINKILKLGVKYKVNYELGRDYFLKDEIKKYDAIFISIGANEPNYTLEGKNILSGNDILERMNKNEKFYFDGKKVFVSGGGDVAMDTARTLKKLGADVTIIYRRDEAQMKAEKKWIECAKKEKIKFIFKANVLSFDSEKKEIKCIKTELVKKEGDSRLSPVNIENSEFYEKCDYLVLANGSKTNKELLIKEGLQIDKNGYIIIDSNMKTSIQNVFAGGDLVGNEKTVAFASKSGRDAAENIITFLLQKNNQNVM